MNGPTCFTCGIYISSDAESPDAAFCRSCYAARVAKGIPVRNKEALREFLRHHGKLVLAAKEEDL